MKRHINLLALVALIGCRGALAQDPLVAFPRNYKLILDEPTVAVMRVHYGPHETVGVHDHSDHPTIYVYLNNSGPVRFEHEGVKTFELDRPPTHAGSFRVSPGRIERHRVDNISDTPSDFLRVELKKVPVGSFSEELRGKAPELPLHAGSTTLFQNKPLRIERIICPADTLCVAPSSGLPSLLVAFSPAHLTSGGKGSDLTFDQPVSWLPKDASAQLRSPSGVPVHVLRITPLSGS